MCNRAPSGNGRNTGPTRTAEEMVYRIKAVVDRGAPEGPWEGATQTGLRGSKGSQTQPEEGDSESQEEMLEPVPAKRKRE